jgi:L-iditol 2-dehydrogenase
MRAAVYEGIGTIAIREVPVPAIGDGELLVRVKACAVCGTDVRTFRHGSDLVRPPVIIGHELAGEVAEVGGRVRGFSVGDPVTIESSTPCLACPACRSGWYNICDRLQGIGFHWDGGFAEYLKVPEASLSAECLLPIPGGLPAEQACLSEPFACAINGQELSRVGAGDAVAVIGAGPLGCMHVELANAAGARQVLLADLLPDRLALARRTVRADRFVDLSRERLKEAVLAATGGRGAEVVIVAAPSATAQEEAVEVAAPRGRVNLFGGLPRSTPTASLNSNTIHYKELSVHGAFGSVARQQRAALELFASGKVNPAKFVTARFPLDRILEAFAASEAKSGYRVVVTMERQP